MREYSFELLRQRRLSRDLDAVGFSGCGIISLHDHKREYNEGDEEDVPVGFSDCGFISLESRQCVREYRKRGVGIPAWNIQWGYRALSGKVTQ